MKLLVAFALMFVAGCSCADNRETLFVRQIQAFDEECVVTPDPGSVFHTGGLLDVAFQGSYTLTPIIDNQMVARQSRESVRAESNGVQIDGAIIRLYETSDPNLPPEETAPVLEFFSYASSYIEPESVGASIFVAIPPEYTARRYEDLCGFAPGGNPVGNFSPSTDLVLVGATVQGLTNGGLSVESPEFFFPVSLCCGCLLTCPAEADDPDVDGPGNCDSTDEVTTIPCALGQDDDVDCRLARGTNDGLLTVLSLCDPSIAL